MRIVVSWLLALVLAVGACSPKPVDSPTRASAPVQASAPTAQPGEWDKVVAAAKKEGTVTIYSGGGADIGKAIGEGVDKEYGIRVEVVSMTPAALVEKVRAERRGKAPTADAVVFSGVVTLLPFLEDQLAIAPPVALPSTAESGIWRTEPYGFDPTKRIIAVNSSLNPVLFVNTDLTKRGEVASLYDLLDPKWRGKIVMEDARLPGAGNATVAAFASLGDDFWSRLAAQNILLLDSSRVISAVALGERFLAVGASQTRAMIAVRAGAPVEFVHVKEGAFSVTKGALLLKDAPHPNAALVVLNWLLTKQGQIEISKVTGDAPTRVDIVADWVYPARRPEAVSKLVAVDADPLYQAKGTELATKTWGRR